MSATNATTNYSFPLFIGTDKPAWLVDWNSAMSAIDSAIKAVDTDVQGAIVDISGLSSTVASHTSSISTISGQITVITTNLNTATGNINTINSLIGNGTPTTTDHTIIGAINELHADQGDLADLTTPAVSLVAAINAITGGGGAVAAVAVSYDNTVSGLSAVNVQAAIDELHSSSNVAYSNTASGLQATNVQAAIDEVAPKAWTKIDTSAILVSNSSSDDATHVFPELINAKELVFYINGGVTIYTPVINEASIKLVANDGSGDNDQFKGWSVITFAKATGTVTYGFRVRGTGLTTTAVSCDAIYYR